VFAFPKFLPSALCHRHVSGPCISRRGAWHTSSQEMHIDGEILPHSFVLSFAHMQALGSDSGCISVSGPELALLPHPLLSSDELFFREGGGRVSGPFPPLSSGGARANGPGSEPLSPDEGASPPDQSWGAGAAPEDAARPRAPGGGVRRDPPTRGVRSWREGGGGAVAKKKRGARHIRGEGWAHGGRRGSQPQLSERLCSQQGNLSCARLNFAVFFLRILKQWLQMVCLVGRDGKCKGWGVSWTTSRMGEGVRRLGNGQPRARGTPCGRQHVRARVPLSPWGGVCEVFPDARLYARPLPPPLAARRVPPGAGARVAPLPPQPLAARPWELYHWWPLSPLSNLPPERLPAAGPRGPHRVVLL